MPSSIAEVDKLFAAGAETVTLTRAEWDAMQEVSKGYQANRTEVYQAQREMERVKRISRPVWRALLFGEAAHAADVLKAARAHEPRLSYHPVPKAVGRPITIRLS